MSDAACPLGGEATVLYSLQGNGGRDTLRIAVRAGQMRHDHHFVVGLVGHHLNVSHVVRMNCQFTPTPSDTANP